MKAKFKTLGELLAAIKSGEVDESKVEVYIDSDLVTIMGASDEYEDPLYLQSDYNKDIVQLWRLALPKATVECD
jgi:hypothetical protein